MNLWIFIINMVKSHHLNFFLVFLKIGVFWKVLTFFLDFEKKGCFKELKISWFHLKKGYFFPNNFLKRGHILHTRTHMCTHLSYESPHRAHLTPANIHNASLRPPQIRWRSIIIYICTAINNIQIYCGNSILSTTFCADHSVNTTVLLHGSWHHNGYNHGPPPPPHRAKTIWQHLTPVNIHNASPLG